MIIDSSVIVAILKDEPERGNFTRKLEAAPKRLMSAGTYLECSIAVESIFGPAGKKFFETLMANAEIEIIPFDHGQAEIARTAYRKFGRNSGHAARLNYGDCFAYALARMTGEPLLFKGDDFSKTDIQAAA